VLTGPLRAVTGPYAAQAPLAASCYDMVRVSLDSHPLTATAVVAWHTDLPRDLQQVLFDSADTVTAALPQPA
jgi:hypothetical protein